MTADIPAPEPTSPIRVATGRWVTSLVASMVAVAGVVGLAVAGAGRGFDAVAMVVVLIVVAVAALVTLTWNVTESRRITREFHATIDRLVATESELRVVLDDLPEAVLPLDAAGVIRAANARAGVLTGAEPAALVGTRLTELVEPRKRRSVVRWLRAAIQDPTSEAEPMTWSMTTNAGEPVEVEATLERSGREEGGFVVRLRDVTERRERVRALEQARRRFQQAFHSAPTGMALVRLDDSVILDANRSLADMLDTPVDDLVGRSIRSITHPDDLRTAAAYRARLELGIADTYLLDQRYRRSDGEFVWARTRVAVTEDEGVPLAITHIEDVTEQRRAAEQLQWAATHDPLTGLPNRTGLITAVDEELLGALPGTVGMLFIDLDHFKTVNDSLGHALGDTLLTELSVRLKATERDGDLLARFGGDEFIVMVTGFDAEAGVLARADEYRAAILEPVVVERTELYVTCSIGYAVNDRDGATAADLLRDADAAMYRAKARGRNCVEGFAPGDQEVTALALRTANELRRGLDRGEVVPYFQPIVELTSGHVVGFEALARWLHPDRGLLMPDQFLPLAEETGLIGEVSAGVMRDALAQMASWQRRGLRFADAYLAVNIGTRQIVDPTFAGAVAQALAETGIAADTLWLEITESALLADVKASTVALRNLRSLGLHLVVDDFGTGYSSLTYLKRFPVEGIKIDKGFVAGLGLDNDDSTIVEAVVRLGRSLGIGVVAEGVETPLQLARLRELECDRGQGYLFGRPRPASIVEAERTVDGRR